jgi:potassium-transporting ATPase ATP-binding subunit
MNDVETGRDKPQGTPPGATSRRKRMRAIYDTQLLRHALFDSLRKFDPRTQFRNPVMFVVWVGALVTASLTIEPTLFGPSSASRIYDGVVTIILLLTVWFANLAESLAEGRGKAQAAFLRRTKVELRARRAQADGGFEELPATALRRRDTGREGRHHCG